MDWRIWNAREAKFCHTSLNEAACMFGPSKIMSMDQREQVVAHISRKTAQ